MNRTIRRWRAWAQSHRARYHAPRRAPGMLALTLRRSPTGTVRNEHRHRATLTWVSRLELHVRVPEVSRIQVLRGVRQRVPEGSRRMHGSFEVPRLLATGPVRGYGRDVRTEARPAHADITAREPESGRGADLRTPLHRVFARTSRFGTAPRPVTARAIPAPVRLMTRGGTRVELRGHGVVGVLHSPRHDRSAGPQTETDSRTVIPPQAPPVRGSLDAAVMNESSVNLLTERVIRQIDRRIVAYRERLGRPA